MRATPVGSTRLTLLAAALVHAAMASAQPTPVPITDELQVNQVAAGNQDSPSIGMAADGSHVIAWKSAGQDGDGTGIVVRKFPADGTSPFNESVFNEATAQEQFSPEVDVNSSGDFLVVWDSNAAGAGLRARRSISNGTQLQSEFRLSVATDFSLAVARASRIDDDSSLGGWLSGGTPHVRRFGADGVAITGDVEVESIVNPSDLNIASAPDGSFVAVFQGTDLDATGGVFAQRFSSAGEAVGDLIHVPEAETNAQTDPDVGVANDGSFVVLWIDDVLGLRARRFAPDGTPRGGEIPVFATVPQSLPQISVTPAGAFVAAFKLGQVHAREFDRLGRPVGDHHTVNTTTAGLHDGIHVAAQADRYAVVWHTQNLDGDALAVARRMYRLLSIFADDFETGDESGWSDVSPD